jgi:hypothetical protein
MGKVKDDLVLIGIRHQEEVREAYNKGYLDGLSTKKPSQAQFNNDHKEVMSYGEEEDLLVLGGNYSYKTAERKFKKFITNNLGLFDEDFGDTDDHMKKTNVSYELYYGEPTYYIRTDRGGIYDCWVWELDV